MQIDETNVSGLCGRRRRSPHQSGWAELAQGEVPTLAVAEIQYSDTSGEMIDQSDDHF
jgi:hypothetical protein